MRLGDASFDPLHPRVHERCRCEDCVALDARVVAQYRYALGWTSADARTATTMMSKVVAAGPHPHDAGTTAHRVARSQPAPGAAPKPNVEDQTESGSVATM